jgi:hypothetical protein
VVGSAETGLDRIKPTDQASMERPPAWPRRNLALGLASLGIASAYPYAVQAAGRRQVSVSNVSELHSALDDANRSGGLVELLLKDGVYPVQRTLNVQAPGIVIASANSNRDRVVLQGDAMSAMASIGNVLRVSAPDFSLRDITVERCRYHAVQIAGESGSHRPQLLHCTFRDTFEQLVKVSGAGAAGQSTCEDGLIEGCHFEFTAGIGPQYYIGGFDGHQCSGWTIRGNTFRNIASPSRHIAEHAIHVWGTRNITVERNLIIDCDRGIGFGMGPERSVRGGMIRNNVILHSANAHPFADVGIILESSANIDVLNNTIFQEHAYLRAIEYRFTGTRGGRVINNLTNRAIASRDGGFADISHNFTRATASMFAQAATGDLRLNASVAGVVDSGLSLAEVDTDFDGRPRPLGAGHDIGAFER